MQHPKLSHFVLLISLLLSIQILVLVPFNPKPIQKLFSLFYTTFTKLYDFMVNSLKVFVGSQPSFRSTQKGQRSQNSDQLLCFWKFGKQYPDLDISPCAWKFWQHHKEVRLTWNWWWKEFWLKMKSKSTKQGALWFYQKTFCSC